MSGRQSSRPSSKVSPAVPCIDLAALGERLRRWRQWRGYSRAALSRLAGVDPMVVSRLEARQKPRLEVETAAKLARVCEWTLDQLCGLAPVPALPAPTPGYTPCPEGMPAWLADGLRTSTEDRQLAAHIFVWQVRGATLKAIAESLTAWGVRPFEGGQWNAARVRACLLRHTRGTKTAQGALLRAYGFGAEARQLAARRTRPRL